MFEKEAKEYTHTKHCEKCFAGHCEKKCFLVKDDFETFKDGAEFGYNKANEWHYVKDELPISDKDRFYFVVDKWNLPMIARFYEEVWSNLTVIDDVIAWKEIVFPKESE